MATVIINDTFTDTDGTLLQNHTPDTGGSWDPMNFRGDDTPTTQNAEVRSNRAQSASSTGTATSRNYRCPAAVPEGYFEITFSVNLTGALSAPINVAWGMDATGEDNEEVNRYFLQYIDSVTTGDRSLKLYKIVEGAQTEIGGGAQNLLTGTKAVVIQIYENGFVRVLVDGVTRLSATNTDVALPGRIGLSLPGNQSNTCWVDNFVVTSYSGGEVADYPEVEDVRDGTEFGGGEFTGTLDLPAEEDVKQGVAYDNETKTGTFEGEGDGRRPIEQFWFG